jgi:hypothetical protein
MVCYTYKNMNGKKSNSTVKNIYLYKIPFFKIMWRSHEALLSFAKATNLALPYCQVYDNVWAEKQSALSKSNEPQGPTEKLLILSSLFFRCVIDTVHY